MVSDPYISARISCSAILAPGKRQWFYILCHALWTVSIAMAATDKISITAGSSTYEKARLEISGKWLLELL